MTAQAMDPSARPRTVLTYSSARSALGRRVVESVEGHLAEAELEHVTHLAAHVPLAKLVT